MSRNQMLSSSLASSSSVFIDQFFLSPPSLSFFLFFFLHVLSLWSVACGVPIIVGHLNELVDHIQQVVVVFLQQPLVEQTVPETHLYQHGHHGVLGRRVHWWLHNNNT